MMHDRGDQLIDRLRLVTKGGGRRGDLAYELLQEIFDGYPVENLRKLLYSGNSASLDAGMWIVSELGTRAEAFMSDVEALLGRMSSYARFHAVDAVHCCADASQGRLIAKVVSLIRDPDRAVRWRVTFFLARGTEEQLYAGLDNVDEQSLNRMLRWLCVDDNAQDEMQFLHMLEDQDGAAGLFAAAGAARWVATRPHLLDLARASADEQVSMFAQEELEALHGGV